MSYHREPAFWRHLLRTLALSLLFTVALCAVSLPWAIRALPLMLGLLYFSTRLALRDQRIRRREQAGQCPQCGYDLRTQLSNPAAQCPECGLPLSDSQWDHAQRPRS